MHRIGFLIAVLLGGVLLSGCARSPVPDMLRWISDNSDLPYTDIQPKIVQATAAEVNRFVFGGADSGGDALGAYDPETHTVYLSDHFPPGSLQAQSVLLHELVHHAQTMAGREYPCHAAGEKDAYALHDKWLGGHGGSLKETLGIGPLFVILVTTCGY